LWAKKAGSWMIRLYDRKNCKAKAVAEGVGGPGMMP